MWWPFKKRPDIEDDARSGEDRRKKLGVGGWIKKILHFIFVGIPVFILRLILSILKWSLLLTGLVAVLITAIVAGIYFSPELISMLDRKYPDKLTEKLVILPITPLSSQYYFHEESGVFTEDNKKVACFSSPEHRRIIDKLEEVPLFERAILASEDKTFYEHNGVDGAAILRAIVGHGKHYIGIGGSKSGASTTTMQLAKSLYKDKNGKDAPRTLTQKIREAVTAIRIERELNKYQIMQRYMNMPYFGRGQYGIEAASHAYFGKSAKDLNLPEVAFIVALINKPALPDRVVKDDAHPDETKAQNRREAIRGAQRVLDLMYEDRKASGVTKVQYAQASIDLEKLTIYPIAGGCGTTDGGKYYTEYVRLAYKDKLALNSGGYQLYVPRDDGLQAVLAKAVEMTTQTYLARHQNDADNGELRAGAVAIQFNGDVLAEVGNINYRRFKYDVIAQGWRQPGSTFKVFTYGGLVETLTNEVLAGENPPESLDQIVAEVNKRCVVLDAPIGVSLGRGRGIKMIQNFHSNSEPLYRGNISCGLAVGESRNAAAMRAGARAGIKNVISLAYRLGLAQDKKHVLQPYPTTAIGASEVNPLSMASTAAFMNGGFKVTPRFVNDICKNGTSLLFKDDEGRNRACDPKGEFHERAERVMHPAVAQAMASVMQGPLNEVHGTASPLRKGAIPGIDPLSAEIWKMKPEERAKRTLMFPLEETKLGNRVFPGAGEIAGKTGTATNADGKTSDVWLLLFIPGPDAHPEKGVMLVFWMGKDSKDHPLGERGSHGGGGFAESGGRNWVHSAATVLQFLQTERGLLKPGNRFRPLYQDEVLLNFDARRFTPPQTEGTVDPNGGTLVDPTDPNTDPNLLKEFPPQEALPPEPAASEPENPDKPKLND